DAVRAEVALLGGARVGIDEQLIVRARLHAGAAADAALAIEIDDAVAAFEERARRTDADARRVGALIAQHREKEAAGSRERALFDGLHPAAVHADGNLVLGLTGDGAGVTSDAFPKVDGEPVIGHSADGNYIAPAWCASAASRSRPATSGNVE